MKLGCRGSILRLRRADNTQIRCMKTILFCVIPNWVVLDNGADRKWLENTDLYWVECLFNQRLTVYRIISSPPLPNKCKRYFSRYTVALEFRYFQRELFVYIWQFVGPCDSYVWHLTMSRWKILYYLILKKFTDNNIRCGLNEGKFINRIGKTLKDKEKLLVNSNFPFSLNIYIFNIYHSLWFERRIAVPPCIPWDFRGSILEQDTSA